MRASHWKSIVVMAFMVSGTARAQVSAAEEPHVFQYEDLTHKVNLNALRGGYHQGGSEKPTYKLRVLARALLIKSEELGLTMDKRKHLDQELGDVFEGEVTALDQLKMEKPLSFTVKGDDIRQLVVKAMEQFGVNEDDVAVAIELEFDLQAKKFKVWPQFTLLQRSGYFLISEKKPRHTIRTSRKIHLTDPSGMILEIETIFPPLKSAELTPAGPTADSTPGK